jgi:membrane protease YdiL (CAAX protease family)
MSKQIIAISDHRKQIIELSIFLFLIMPSMVLSFFITKHNNLGFILTAITTIMRDLALVSLVLYFVWNSHKPLSVLGIQAPNPFLEICLGIILFIPFFYFSIVLVSILVAIGLQIPSQLPHSFVLQKGTIDKLVAIVLVIVVAFSEETIFRGYLILRFKEATQSVTWAVFLSSFVFSLGHGYQGSAGVVTVGAMGLIFSLIYLWRGNLLAPMTMHFLQDIISIVVVSAAGSK